MAIDNRDLFKEILKQDFEEHDDILHTIMFLSRSKDKSSNKLHKTFHFDNINDFMDIYDKIPTYCEKFNSRAYITINNKDIKSVALSMIRNLTIAIDNNNNNMILDIFNKTYGSVKKTKGRRKLLIDVDTNDISVQNFVKDKLSALTDILYEIPSKNGIHYIVNGFNINLFKNDIKILTDDNPKIVEVHDNVPNSVIYSV